MKLQQAFEKVPRINFLPDESKNLANMDRPIPIGYGQTNSQPYTVKLMLDWLDVTPGQNILDVGSGSGWTSCLLAFLVGDKGKITALERVPELVVFGRENCERLGYKNVTFHRTTGIKGWPDNAPYDRILVSASTDKFPQILIEQLSINGRIVIPIRDIIFVIDKDSNNNISKTEHPGFVFVPLIG